MTRLLPMFLLSAACHQDYCERLEESDLACDQDHPKEATDRCQDALRACSEDDVDLLERYQDCYEQAGAAECDPAATAYIAALDCLPILDGLSDGCVAARSSWTTTDR